MAIFNSIKQLLEEAQLSGPLRERLKLHEEKYQVLETANAQLKSRNADLEKQIVRLNRQLDELKSQIPDQREDALDDDDQRLLIHLFRSGDNPEPRPFEEPIRSDELRQIAHALGAELGVAKYRLDRLLARGLAETSGGNYAYGHVYWALTEAGRAYVVERGLLG